MTVELQIERDDQYQTVTVHLYYQKGCRAPRDTIVRRGDGPPLSPDDETSLEFEDCDVELTEKEQEQAIRLGWDKINDR